MKIGSSKNKIDHKFPSLFSQNAASRHSTASFDVYNIETALPVIDLEALENHLAAKMAEDQSVSKTETDHIRLLPRIIMSNKSTDKGNLGADKEIRCGLKGATVSKPSSK